MTQREMDRACEILSAARSICVSTGSGMSAESGVATFRGADGLWNNFRPEELATPAAFRRQPAVVWAWYRTRRAQVRAVEPHAGHLVLAAWEARLALSACGSADSEPDRPLPFTLVTQNVDGLHHRAGSRNIIELHGRLDIARCTGCALEQRGLDDLGEDPRCPCGARMRPGVVWFGEMLPDGALELAANAAAAADVFLVIGTSGVVEPATSLIHVARSNGAKIIEINPEATPLSGLANVVIRAKCGAALTAIEERWR